MIRTMMTATAAMALLTGIASSASAAPCRDAKGKFIKCPPPPLRLPLGQGCQGKFEKCGTAGAVPIKK